MKIIPRIVIVLISVLISCWLVVQTIHELGKWREFFIADKWAMSDAEVRYGMVADLIYRRRLIGLTRTQTLHVLGPSDQEDDHSLSYHVGPAFGDSETLLVTRFGGGGKCSQVDLISRE